MFNLFIEGYVIAKFKKRFEKTITGKLPNQIYITKASGMANRAIWEFYSGEGIEEIGQYDLEIIFRLKDINNKVNPATSLFYCIDWNVEINGRKLYDHEFEYNNDYWNTKLNGIKIMYHEKDDSQKDNWTAKIPTDKEEQYKELREDDVGIKRHKIKNNIISYEYYKYFRPLLIFNEYKLKEDFSFIDSFG